MAICQTKYSPRRMARWRRGIAWLETLLALSLLALAIQLLWPTFMSWWHYPRAGNQVSAIFQGKAGSLRYLIYLPEEYRESKKQPWPLLLFLHGAGERGDDLNKVRQHGPAAGVDSGKSFPLILVSPQCFEKRTWQPELLLELLEEIKKNFHVDSNRIYITGYSMGGFGTWALAESAPEQFAALVPICGGGSPSWSGKLANLPTWAFHGANDKAVPLESSQTMVNAIRSEGGDIKLTIYPEEGHGIWEQTYKNPKVYEWMLRQKRN